ncbi:MAG: AsmA family protein [Alphaproteobacteria bacterium]|nr:AsmA family protein [Alphaproteobacteria bacterium]
MTDHLRDSRPPSLSSASTDSLNSVDPFGDDRAEKKHIPKWAKYLGGTALGLVLVVAGAGVVATKFMDQSKYKHIIVEKLAQSTGYQVDWRGDIAISLLPLPHATVHDLKLSNQGENFITVKDADIELELWPLLSKKINIENVTLSEPQITLTTHKDGRQGWMSATLSKKQSPENVNAADSKAAADSASAPGYDFSLNMLQIINGVLIWDDQSSSSLQKFEDVDITAKADSLHGPFDVNGGLVWNGRKIESKITTSTLDFKNSLYPVKIQMALPESNVIASYGGTIRMQQDKIAADGDINLTIDNLGKAVSGLSPDQSSSIPEELSGKTTLDGKLSYDSEKILLSNLRLENGNLSYLGNFSLAPLSGTGAGEVVGAGQAAPEISFSLNSADKVPNDSSVLEKFLDDLSIEARGSLQNGTIQLRESRVLLDNNDLSLTGSIGLSQKDMQLSLQSHQLDIDQILAKLGNKGDSASNGALGPSQSSDAPQSMGFALPFNGQIQADLAQVKYQGLSYQNIQSTLILNGQSLKIDKFAAQLPQSAKISAQGSIGKTDDLSDLNLTFSLSAPDTESLAQAYHLTLPQLSRKIGPSSIKGTVSGSLKQLSFDLTTTLWGLSVSGIGSVANLLETPIINQIKFALSSPNFVQSVRLVQPEFTATSGFEGPFKLSGNAVWENNEYHLSDVQGLLGKTTLNGHLDVTTAPKLAVKGAVNLGRVVLSQNSGSSANSASGTKSAAKAASAQNTGSSKWSREAINVDWMRNFDAQLKIKAETIIYDLWTLNQANLDFALTNGTLTIADAGAGIFGGRVLLTGEVKSGAGAHDPLSVKADFKGENIAAGPLLSAALGKTKDIVSGNFRKADINLSATGISPAALVQTLNGAGSITGENIIVKGVDAAGLATAARGSFKPLERAGSLFGSFANGQTQFATFESLFTAQNGVVNLSKILFDGDQASLNSTGTVNLPQWWIELNNSMTVKNTDIPPFDFTIKGPLDSPTQAGGAAIENYLRGKLQNKLDKVIDKQINKLLKLPAESSSDGANAGTAGATSGGATDGTVQPALPEEPKPKDILKNEAAKALGNLLGQ